MSQIVWNDTAHVDVANLVEVGLPPVVVAAPFPSVVEGVVDFHDLAPSGVYRLRHNAPLPPGLVYGFGWPGGDSFGPELDITHTGGAGMVGVTVKAVSEGAAPGGYDLAVVLELL